MSVHPFTFVVLGALGFIALERRRPYEPRQRTIRAGLLDDLVLYGLMQSYLLGVAIAALIAAVERAFGLGPVRFVTGWPAWLQLAFFLVTHDLYIYVFHRMQHRVPILWRIHEAHHATPDVDWISGARSHPLEILINQSIEFGAMLLLGASTDVVIWKGVIDSLWGMYIHSNVDVRTGRLQYFINGPEMHRWHHAREIIDVNFATKLAIWDWLFGTAYHPGHKPRSYGLADDAVFPRGYFAQVLHAFRPPTRPTAPSELVRLLPR